MKVRLLSLNIDKSMSFTRFQARIVSSIKPYAVADSSFENAENMRDFFGLLQDALENDELIVTAVDVKHYAMLKNAFIQAFETDVIHDPSVLNMLESNEEMDDETRKQFSAFPEPATIFLSKDGLYSGFGIENGSQFVLFLPIDNERINHILRNGAVPFLAQNIKTSEVQNYINAAKQFGDAKVSKAVERLIESGSVVAINGTPNAEILKSCGDNTENFDDVFIFTPHVEDKGDVNVTEYAAQLAKVSLDLSAANIGASISEIYDSGEARYICIAVANNESAVVRKLYMSDGETEYAFIESAALELIELIGEKAAGLRSVGIEIAEESNQISDDDKKPAGKKPVAIMAIILGVIILLCAVLGIVYKMQGENGPLAAVFDGIFGKETTTTTTTPTTTEPPTEAEPAVVKKKLSDFITADLIALEKAKAEAATEEASTEEEATSEEPEVEVDKGAPETMKINGQIIDAKEALARLVMTEMGEGYDVEALKAQAVVIYTYLKYRDTDFTIDGVEISDTYNEEVKSAVDSVFGQYLTYKGDIALTPYFAIAARKTTDSENVFSQSYPYLKSVEVDGNPDSLHNAYKIEKTYSAGEVKGLLLEKNSEFALTDDPTLWIIVNEQDASISSSIGYVTRVTVGGVEMTGIELRELLGAEILASHCFTVSYDDAAAEFIVTTYGSGYGVGMSQTGANSLAAEGVSYKKILSTYYNGTTITEEEQV